VQVSATSLVRFGLYGRGVGIEGVLEIEESADFECWITVFWRLVVEK